MSEFNRLPDTGDMALTDRMDITETSYSLDRTTTLLTLWIVFLVYVYYLVVIGSY